MNKIIISILLALSSSLVFAQDFRGLNFGDSCEIVPGNERNFGSTQLGEYRLEYQEYEGIYLDRLVKIFYDCGNNGVLNRGTYIFEFSNLNEAISFFELAKPQLVMKYGEPEVDASTPKYMEVMSRIGVEVAEIDKYNLLWKKNGIKINLSTLKPSNHSEAASVGIDFTPSAR